MAKAIKEILNNETKLQVLTQVAFRSVDIDSSGSIDENELKNLLITMSSDMGTECPTQETINNILKELDTNQSGKIEMKEFERFIRHLLNALITE